MVPKNVKGRTLLVFLTFNWLQNIKKLEGGPLKNYRNKVAQCQTNWKGDPLVSTGFVRYVKSSEGRGFTAIFRSQTIIGNFSIPNHHL